MVVELWCRGWCGENCGGGIVDGGIGVIVVVVVRILVVMVVRLWQWWRNCGGSGGGSDGGGGGGGGGGGVGGGGGENLEVVVMQEAAGCSRGGSGEILYKCETFIPLLVRVEFHLVDITWSCSKWGERFAQISSMHVPVNSIQTQTGKEYPNPQEEEQNKQWTKVP